MVNVIGTIGEFRSVRASNIQAVVEGQRDHAEAIDSEGQAGAKAAPRGATCAAGYARTLPKAVTPAEKLEERLGVAMLKRL